MVSGIFSRARARCQGSFAAQCNARSRALLLVAYGLTPALVACRVSSPPEVPIRAAAEDPPAQLVQARPPAVGARAPQRVATTIVSPDHAIDVEELFVHGQTCLRQGRPKEAAATFDRIVTHEPQGPFTERALFQGALAHEAAGDLEAAAARFEELAQRLPHATRAAEALVRSMRLRMHLEHWERAGDAAAIFLERHPAAPPGSRIVALAARSLGLLSAERVEEADRAIAQGMEIVERLELDRAGRIPRDLAQLYFALGESRRQRAAAVRLEGDTRSFAARLEQRCQLLLAAQGAYSDTMRAHDAHWSTIAGYRVGELYERLHAELVALPPPRAVSEREQQLFEGAMRLRYSVLLTKAASMMEHTLAMAERTGEDSEWVRRTAQSRRNLEEAMRAEQRALDRLPFTRADLQRALDNLADRHEDKGQAAAAHGADEPGGRPARRSGTPGNQSP